MELASQATDLSLFMLWRNYFNTSTTSIILQSHQHPDVTAPYPSRSAHIV